MPTIDDGPLPHTDKSGTMMRGTMLYPFVPSAAYQSGHGTDNRMLWATLTPHGTRHFVSEAFVTQDDHYEVIDYHNQRNQINCDTMEKHDTLRQTQIKAFENSGFVDFDYEDPTPLMESYNTDDMDSGYQEPQNLSGSFNDCSLRTYVSTPTRIDNPNMTPLNLYQSRSTLDGSLSNKKGGHKTSDLSNRNLKI